MLYLSVLRSLARSTLVDPHFAGVALPAQSHLPNPVLSGAPSKLDSVGRQRKC